MKVEDLARRYVRLVARWTASAVDPAGLARIAAEARELSEEAGSPWYRVQSLALAAAADVTLGEPLDVRALLDTDAPVPDASALARLSDHLPGDGTIVARLATYRAATTVPLDRVCGVAEALLALLGRRAADDLDLPAGIPARQVVMATVTHDTPRARVERSGHGRDHRLVLDGTRPWTVGNLTRVIVSGGVFGGHLVDTLRPTMPAWSPSPQATVDHGMRSVAREVLLGDHEFGTELARIGRQHGLRWSGEQVVGIERALDDLGPALASVAMSGRPQSSDLTALGLDEGRAVALLGRWEDTLQRAECVSRAAGPQLVRQWLVRVGQTSGLGRLVRERMVPSQLRDNSTRG